MRAIYSDKRATREVRRAVAKQQLKNANAFLRRRSPWRERNQINKRVADFSTNLRRKEISGFDKSATLVNRCRFPSVYHEERGIKGGFLSRSVISPSMS